MNLLERVLMEGPSVETSCCAICGRTFPLNRHHIVRRSAGGNDGPTIVLCGVGSNLRDANGRMLHHGMIHHHMLHLDLRDGWWWYLVTQEPVKYERALRMDGWRPVSRWDEVYAKPTEMPF